MRVSSFISFKNSNLLIWSNSSTFKKFISLPNVTGEINKKEKKQNEKYFILKK